MPGGGGGGGGGGGEGVLTKVTPLHCRETPFRVFVTYNHA